MCPTGCHAYAVIAFHYNFAAPEYETYPIPTFGDLESLIDPVIYIGAKDPASSNYFEYDLEMNPKIIADSQQATVQV